MDYFFFLVQVESYNIDDLSKNRFLPMLNKCGGFTPICIGKYVYVFGGHNGTSVLSACER